MPIPVSSLVVGAQLGRYRIIQSLGKGGMGAVYLAQDVTLGRSVALKVPHVADENSRARFLREARAAATLSHPNICPVFDVGEHDGHPYLVMEFIHGQTLSQRVQAHPLKPIEAARLIRAVAVAVHEAHRRGIVHRDLKPSNIMINDRQQPIVMDFGLARNTDESADLTAPGEVMGTVIYMPPEQMMGESRTMGPSWDVYSLGVIFYELLTGVAPYRGPLQAVMAQVLYGEEAPPPSSLCPGLDTRLDTLCMKSMSRDSAERFPNMYEFVQALDGFLTSPSRNSQQPSRSTPPEVKPEKKTAPPQEDGDALDLGLVSISGSPAGEQSESTSSNTGDLELDFFGKPPAKPKPEEPKQQSSPPQKEGGIDFTLHDF